MPFRTTMSELALYLNLTLKVIPDDSKHLVQFCSEGYRLTVNSPTPFPCFHFLTRTSLRPLLCHNFARTIGTYVFESGKLRSAHRRPNQDAAYGTTRFALYVRDTPFAV